MATAKETAARIEGAIIKTARGVQLGSKVALALNANVTKARQVDELASEVAGASREQSQGIHQINAAVGQMEKVTQSNAATAEESAADAEELNSQAEMTKQAVGELLELIGGITTTAAIHPPAVPTPVRKPLKATTNGQSLESWRGKIISAMVLRRRILADRFAPTLSRHRQGQRGGQSAAGH